MSHNHVALIIAEDAWLAETLVNTVISLGHTPYLIRTRDDALAEIEKRCFCYVLLGMEWLDRSTAMPSAVPGFTLLKNDLRGAFPGRTGLDKHRVQIVAITETLRSTDFVTRVMQEGADDFVYVSTPHEKDVAKIAEKVNGCLRHSERRDHARCEEATKVATRASVAPPPSTRAATAKVQVHVTARVSRSRYDLRVGERATTCTEGSLHKLLTFAAARAGGASGWIPISELGREDAVHKALSRLRLVFKQLLSEHGIDDLLTNDNGKYRLNERIAVSVDEALTRHESAGIRALSAALRSGVAPVSAKKLSAMIAKTKPRSPARSA